MKTVPSGTRSEQTASHNNARHLSHEPQLSILQGYQGPLMSRYGIEHSQPEMKGQQICTSSGIRFSFYTMAFDEVRLVRTTSMFFSGGLQVVLMA